LLLCRSRGNNATGAESDRKFFREYSYNRKHPAIADQFDVSITIPSMQNLAPLFHHAIPVICAELLQAQGFHLLIGRDVQECLLSYDGRNGLFTLAY